MKTQPFTWDPSMLALLISLGFEQIAYREGIMTNCHMDGTVEFDFTATGQEPVFLMATIAKVIEDHGRQLEFSEMYDRSTGLL